MQNTELLLEDLSGLVHFGAQQGGKKLFIDREKGIIKGVKIIGFNSQNGRKYLPEALKDAVPMYEGIKVNNSSMFASWRVREYTAICCISRITRWLNQFAKLLSGKSLTMYSV